MASNSVGENQLQRIIRDLHGRLQEGDGTGLNASCYHISERTNGVDEWHTDFTLSFDTGWFENFGKIKRKVF